MRHRLIFICSDYSETFGWQKPNNRSACAALMGIGNCVPNKQMRLWLPKTLLATIHPSKKIFPSDVTFPFKTASRYQLW